METFTNQIRRAINESGMTRYRIAKLSGVTEGTLSRFMAGALMRSDSLDALAPVLGLSIAVKKSKSRKRQ